MAAPPYDVTVTFTAIPATGFNFYMDDCAVSGPIGLPIGEVISGQKFSSLVVADGTYQFCVRAFNDGVDPAGNPIRVENPGPGQVATAVISDLPLPGTIDNLGIQVTCPTSNCTINVTIQ